MSDTKPKGHRELPTLPHILLKIIEVCHQDDVQFGQLSAIIEKDPALTTKILRMINSPIYNLPNKVVSLEKALVLIGIDAVKNIALCASIHQVFADAHDGENFHLKAFWQHSLMCATLCRSLAERFKFPNTDEAFLAGLLHDIGKLVIWADNPKEYDKLVGQFRDKPEKLLSEEVKMGGLHSELGSRLIAEWNLPSLMTDAVLYHHEPLFRIVDSFILVKIVYVANQISREEETALAVAETVFGITSDEVKLIADKARHDTQEAARNLDIEIEEEQSDGPEKKKQLVNEIRDISMLLGTMQSILRATDQESLFRILYQALKILFGIENAVLFEYDFERDLLVSRTNGTGATNLQGLLIPYQDSGAVVAQSLRDRKALNSWDHGSNNGGEGNKGSLVDEQLARMLEKEGIICVPLLSGKTRLGVLAVGTDQTERASLTRQQKRLTLLTAQFAASLHNFRQRSLQTRVIHSERVIASTELAHRIVHEVRNPLGIIRNYMKILERKLTEEHGVVEELTILQEEISRVGRLLDELSEFSEPPQAEERSVDVNQLIADASAMIRDSLLSTGSIALHLDFDNSLGPVDTQEDSLKQIVLNLLKNSIEAVPAGGNITITTRKIESVPAEIPFDTSAESFAEITVSDDGPGIPETLRVSLFDPYTGTKKDHQGLGLSIVYNLVRNLGGMISVKSRKKEGSMFTILLPIV